ncbi:hypothetical protein ACVGVM_20485 [Pseudonocardia bannensis]|uniref:Peptidase C39-like domain-containing protein n=1 Tax=Pseudonocardia bannensis TaxID=630973 RepID=A0A848DFN7_9PSEU|nr:hypothetical protein [Pseudonocardia bannensis]NMH91468.1 hypothetical protein [Pseudonocardia bannensis]
MRTVSGLARRVQRALGGRRPAAASGVARALPGGRSLLTDVLGEQRRGGVRLDQADPTTCGSAVLVAMAAWADPAESERLDGAVAGAGSGTGFGIRYDDRQRRVHRETNRIWPRALGTTPWGMARWLRVNVPGAGPYRVRLVDDASPSDVEDVLAQVGVALSAGHPVPLLVGSAVPRHYVLVLGPLGDGAGGWRVYEPTTGSVRVLDLALVRRRRLAPVLGFDRLHAVLLPG